MSSQARLEVTRGSFQNRVAVKFVDGLTLPYQDGLERFLDTIADPYRQAIHQALPAIAVNRQFVSLTATEVETFDAKATSNNPDWASLDSHNYFLIAVPQDADCARLISSCGERRRLSNLRTDLRLVSRPASCPGKAPLWSKDHIYLETNLVALRITPHGGSLVNSASNGSLCVAGIQQPWKSITRTSSPPAPSSAVATTRLFLPITSNGWSA